MTSLCGNNGSRVLPETFWMKNLKKLGRSCSPIFSDLMEDTTDFSWQGAKASHAVLLCEMERGAVTWSETGRIDHIRRAHAQKHVTTLRFFGRSNDSGNKRPWFCKFFQSGTCSHSKDHETNGRLHRHICAHCLENGKQLNHS